MKYLWIMTLLVSGLMAAEQGFNMPKFSFFDTNGDGKITKSELDDGRQKRHNKMAKEGRMLRNIDNAPSFSDIDTNGNGAISPEEFSAHQKARRTR